MATKAKPSFFTQEELVTLERLWRQGVSDTVIAERLGRWRGTIRRKAAELDLPPLATVRAKLWEHIP